MKVRLLRHVVQGGSLKVAMRRGRDPVPFVRGAVVEMSEASGRKYVDKRWAEEVPTFAADPGEPEGDDAPGDATDLELDPESGEGDTGDE